MKEVKIRKGITCRIYYSDKDAKNNNTLCYFKVLRGEILIELLYDNHYKYYRDYYKYYSSFRIYKKDNINELDIVKMLLKYGCFNDKIDKKYDFVAK